MPAFWSAIGSAAPLFSLIVGYWHLSEASPPLVWALAALAVAAAMTLSAGWARRRADTSGMAEAQGVFGLGAFACIAFALSLYLELNWLTVGLALMLPAAAWIDLRFRVPFLRHMAGLLAGLVAFRLVAPGMLPWSLLGGGYGVLDVLYTYGLPAACFRLAARWFGGVRQDHIERMLNVLAIVAAVLTADLMIRAAFAAGEQDAAMLGLFEHSLHALTWLSAGWGLRRAAGSRIEVRKASECLIIGGVAQIAIVNGVLLNPLVSGKALSNDWLAPELFTGYLAPALAAFAAAFGNRRRMPRKAADLLAYAGVALAFMFVTLLVRHVVHGADIGLGSTTDAEIYAYSAVWLAFAAGLMAAGVGRRIASLRHAALALISIVIVKVFVWDMAGLEGLYRVVSFLGLGLSLVAAGYLYQRVARRLGDGRE